QRNAEASNRLKEAIASVSESTVPSDVRVAKEQLGEKRAEQLRLRAAPALTHAATMRAKLAQWDNEWGSMLNEVRELNREQLLLGVPAEAHQLYTHLSNPEFRSGLLELIEDVRGSLDRTLSIDRLEESMWRGSASIDGGFE